MQLGPRRLALPLVLSLAAACGDNAAPPVEPDGPSAPPDARPDAHLIACDDADPAASIASLPGVTSVTPMDCGGLVSPPASCFLIAFEQPIDQATDAPVLTQRLWLTHRSCASPTLIADWGYSWDFFYDDELSVLYQTNSLWVEHRFQGESLPAPGHWDWTALTIENGAGDLHRVITAFKNTYGGRWVSTGASKGGITATYHKYFFPDDLDGSVPYVAPASRARIDPAYQDNLEAVLPNPCATRLRNVQVAALTTRRTMMLDRVGAIVGSDFAVEALEQVDASLEWGFWQGFGYGECGAVPTTASTDDQFFQFFLDYSFLGQFLQAPAGPAADDERSFGALYYEWLTEQGFALQIGQHVAPLLHTQAALMTMEDVFDSSFPTVTLPAYDGAVTAAVRDWVRDTAEDVVLIYGQYDPWSGGAMDEPTRATSGRFYVPEANHGAQILGLAPADQDAALALITPMFGRDPVDSFKPAARRAGAMIQAAIAGKQRQAIERQAWRFLQTRLPSLRDVKTQ